MTNSCNFAPVLMIVSMYDAVMLWCHGCSGCCDVVTCFGHYMTIIYIHNTISVTFCFHRQIIKNIIYNCIFATFLPHIYKDMYEWDINCRCCNNSRTFYYQHRLPTTFSAYSHLYYTISTTTTISNISIIQYLLYLLHLLYLLQLRYLPYPSINQ